MAHVFFDLDHTLITAQSQSLLLDTLYKNKYISFINLLRLRLFFILYKLHITPQSYLDTIYVLVAKMMKDKEVAPVDKLVHDFVFKTFPSIENKVAVDELQKHIISNHTIILSSSAFEPIVKAAADYFQIREYRCSKLEIFNGKYTGKLDGLPNYGLEKLNKLLDFDFTDSYGYSDHQSDIKVLEKTTHPYAVTPTSKMKSFAVDHHWQKLK